MELIFYAAPLCPDEKLAGLLALAEGIGDQSRKSAKKTAEEPHYVLKCADKTYEFADTARNLRKLKAAGAGHFICVTVTSLPREEALHIKEIQIVC